MVPIPSSFAIDPQSGELHFLNKVPTRGTDPCHVSVDQTGKYALVANFASGNVAVLPIREDGSPAEASAVVQHVPTLPESFEGQSTCADIHVDPSGSYLFGSNRGHDSIVIYTIDSKTGRLTYVGHESTRGRTPRNFAVDPSGRFLFAANQDSNTVVQFSIDQQTGRLQPSGGIISAPTPACMKILRL